MLTEAEKSYYLYITRFYTGIGAVVEVGPWLGLSTHFIVTGLMSNPQFEEERVYVFDDFTWRSSWMDKWLRGTEIPAPPNHSSFLHLFEQQVASLLDRVVVRQCKLCDADGNEGLPLIRWSGGPIELIIVDCGRTLQVNEAWWTEFNQSFIANRTLIIMQDWQNHKRVPELFWENTRLFTDSKGDALDLIHEVRDAAIATFLYRGTGN